MNELEVKLNSNNPVLISQVISKLAEAIRKNYKDELKQVQEYKYLSDLCFSSTLNRSLVASDALANLVEMNVLPLKVVVKDFMAKIYGEGNLTGAIHLIHNLVVMESYKENINYDLASTPHPLIQILERDSNYAETVINCIENFHSRRNSSKSNNLFRPLYHYILNEPKVSILMKQRLWLHILGYTSGNDIYGLLKWMQLSGKEQVAEHCNFLKQFIGESKAESTDEALILYSLAILYECIKHDLNPHNLIITISTMVYKIETVTEQKCALYVLASCIERTPCIYLEEILKLCWQFLNQFVVNSVLLHRVKVAVLPWLLYPCFLMEKTKTLAEHIINFAEKTETPQCSENMSSSKTFSILKHTSSTLLLSFSLGELSESWINENDVDNWLKELEKTPLGFKKSVFPFLLALFMKYFEKPVISIKCLHFLTEVVRTYKTWPNNLLILLLYKLPTTTNSTLHYHILKTLPKLASRDENALLVRLTIESLSKTSPDLQTFSISLLYDMWKEDNKFYLHLERVLSEPPENPTWEYYVTKSYVLKEICLAKPELYGKDMVPYLSKILNECTSQVLETPCALAIEGIKVLCQSGIVDVVTTWSSLKGLYESETRPVVIGSLCELLEEVPNFSSKSEKYYKLIEEVVAKLWDFVTMSNEVEVIGSALKALSCYNFEDVAKHLPDIYRVGEKPSDELLFDKVPGVCWIKFLENGNFAAMKQMGDFLITLVRQEISSYTKMTYSVTQQQREPQNYGYLPQHSVVRAIGTYLQNEVEKWKSITKPVYLECLRVFSEEYSKPLPPFTWSFLQELVHEPEARHYCITIACHQVMLSGTARRLIENFLSAMTEVQTNERDALVIYRNLKHLCNSIQPIILKPFLEKSLNHILNTVISSQGTQEMQEIFSEMTTSLKRVLTNDSVQEANKAVIIELIANNVQMASKKDDTFKIYLECVLALPPNHIELVSSPKTYDNISQEQYRSCVKIRSTAAFALISKVPVDFMKELFYSASSEIKKNILLNEVTCSLENQENKVVCSTWIMDLMGLIQTTIAEEEEFSMHLHLFLDIFILSVNIFSGYKVFATNFDFEQLRFVFPLALCSVVKTTYFNHRVLEILEWLHHIVQLEFLPMEYRVMALDGLVHLRNETEFRKGSRWRKYISDEFLFG